jgi:ABC-2 type transport system ATP-binding protein
MWGMIEIAGLQKVVDGRAALDIGSLRVADGELAALVGPSGSGKMLLRELLTGRQQPTAGTIRLDGHDPWTDKTWCRRHVGVLFAEDALYESRSPRGNLAFHARLRGLPKARVGEVLDLVGLSDQAEVGLRGLSSGLRRRLAFGVAILHAPTILVLTEPFARCDEASIDLLGGLMRRLTEAGAAGLVMASAGEHLDGLCAVRYTLDQGRIVAETRPGDETAEPMTPFKIPVKLEGSVALINPGDVMFAAAEEGRAILQTFSDRFPTQYTLAELEERLARSGFFRAHRSYLVNLQHVREVIPYTRSSFSLRLNDEAGTKIPLSKDAERELRELLDF